MYAVNADEDGYEMIENNITGLHIPVTEYADKTEIDSSLLAEKILYLLQHPIETKRMGENGRKKYLSNYHSDIFRENMLKMYELCWRHDEGKIKVLIVTGQSNHNWEISHLAIKQILENSGLFTVNVAISPEYPDNSICLSFVITIVAIGSNN